MNGAKTVTKKNNGFSDTQFPYRYNAFKSIRYNHFASVLAQAKPDEDHPYGDKTGKTFCKHILKSKSALEIIINILSRTFPTIFLLNLFVLNNPASF